MQLNRNSFRIPPKTACRSGVLIGALVSTVLLASPAHAETDMRVCGVISKSSSHPSENVGFVMKVQKNDARTCQLALDRALDRFNQVGGTANLQGLNRIWRRVRGGSLGPFAGKRVYSQSFSRTTCEDFTWYASDLRADHCFRMKRNQLYSIASAYREFALRGE